MSRDQVELTNTNPFKNSVRSTCTVTKYADITNAVATCTDIVLDSIAVPASSAIDLQKLKSGATVTFSGKTVGSLSLCAENITKLILSRRLAPLLIMTLTLSLFPEPVLLLLVLLAISLMATVRHTGTAKDPIMLITPSESNLSYFIGRAVLSDTIARPDHFIVVKKTSNAKITNLNIQNWPVHCFSITGNTDLNISGLTLNNAAGDQPNSKSNGKPAAHNSDGFDISSSDGVTLNNINVHNQDDCVAVTSGSRVTVSNMYCYGGHGLSIGSVGGKSNNTVDGVTFLNSQVVNSENGCRIKSNSGTTGTVSTQDTRIR